MMTGPKHWPIAYPAFMAVLATIGIANYYLLKWLQSRDRRRQHPPPQG